MEVVKRQEIVLDFVQYSVDEHFGTMRLAAPTSDTPTIAKATAAALDEMFRERFLYKQAGVILGDISNAQRMQLDLFSEPENERHRKLMEATDRRNKKFGDNTIRFS